MTNISDRVRIALVAVLLALGITAGSVAVASPSQANGWVTIFPNYGDWVCGPTPGGAVQHVKVAGFPGNTTVNANNQRWARLEVSGRGNVRIVAQVYCVYGAIKAPGGWKTVERTISNPVPWKSYYF